jgi:hypothetical protein
MKIPCDQSKVVELYKSGKSISDLCEVFDRVSNSIYLILKKHGVLRSKTEGLKLARENGKIYKRKPIDDLLEDEELLLKEYETQSLTEIANKFHTERKRLVKACKKYGIPIKRWDEKIHKIQSKIRESKLDQRIIDPNWMRVEYIDKQRGIDEIAFDLNCSITAVRNRLKRFNIPIRPQKRFGREKELNKKSHGVNVIYKPIKCLKSEIVFRSILECAYAVYLDSLEEIISWDYEVSWIWYLDSFSGKEKKYICDFKIEYKNKVEHVEVKPLELQTFEDKYLCAQRQLINCRWVTKDELEKSKTLFSVKNDRVIFNIVFSQKKKKFIIWTKEDTLTVPNGFRILSKNKKYGHIFQYKIINDNMIINKPKIAHYDRPNNVKHGNIIILNLDEILALIKKNETLFKISKRYNVDSRTISKFLEDRSYVIRWGGTSSKHNEIRYATKLIWPLKELPPRKAVRNRVNHKWDNQQWLYQKYINEKLSTRIIGKLVGVSGRLILKKLRKYNIETRSLNNGIN